MKKLLFKSLVLLALLTGASHVDAQTCTASVGYSYAPNGSVQLWVNASPTSSLTFYLWTYGNGNTYSTTGSPAAFTGYTVNGTYTVSVYLSTPSTCTATAFAVITITNAPLSSTCNLNANFFYTQSGSVVNFYNNTTGTVSGTTYTWSYGDTTSSNSPAPTHTYALNGTYIVTLTASNNSTPACISTSTMMVSTTPTCNVNAAFTWSVNGNTVTFFNLSTPTTTPLSFLWKFGNGATSNTTSPVHNYAAGGTYTVVLHAMNTMSCQDSVVHYITIAGGSTCNLTANFSYSQGSNGVVNFINTSTGTNGSTTYAWNFGNGNSSSTSAPTTTYTSNGAYVATLTASNGGTCVSTKTMVVNVTSICGLNASFSHTQNANGLVNFAAAPTGSMYAPVYAWKFGDNTNGYGITTSHTYPTGVYVVTLTMTYTQFPSICVATAIQTINVTNTCVANASFSLAPTATAQYWNAYPSAPQNVVNATWYWGDSTWTNGLYTSHQYSAAGTYDICLTVTVACGATDTYCYNYAIYRSSGAQQVIHVNVVDPATVGMKEAAAGDLKVFPNPASHILYLENIKGDESVGIYNLLGEQVHSQKNATREIDISGLPSGVYIIAVEKSDAVLQKRIVINR